MAPCVCGVLERADDEDDSGRWGDGVPVGETVQVFVLESSVSPFVFNTNVLRLRFQRVDSRSHISGWAMARSRKGLHKSLHPPYDTLSTPKLGSPQPPIQHTLYHTPPPLGIPTQARITPRSSPNPVFGYRPFTHPHIHPCTQQIGNSLTQLLLLLNNTNLTVSSDSTLVAFRISG